MKVRKIKKCNESFSFNKPNSINDSYDISKLIKFINEYNKIDDHSKDYEYNKKISDTIVDIAYRIGYKRLTDRDFDISIFLNDKINNYIDIADKFYDCYIFYNVYAFNKYPNYGIIVISPSSEKLGLPFKYILVDLEPKTIYNVKEHK